MLKYRINILMRKEAKHILNRAPMNKFKLKFLFIFYSQSERSPKAVKSPFSTLNIDSKKIAPTVK